MSRIVVINHITLDGVMQAPAQADEDTRDSFEHGGWATPYSDDRLTGLMGERMGQMEGFLFGHRTYLGLAAYWPQHPEHPFTIALTNTPKYVASRSETTELPWENSVLLAGDAAERVAELRQRGNGNLIVFGSGDLCRSLAAASLIDEYVLLINPIVLGTGRRMFGEGWPSTEFRLEQSTATPTGIVVAVYQHDPRIRDQTAAGET